MYEMEGPRPVPPPGQADHPATARPQDPPPVPDTRLKRQFPGPPRVPGSPPAVPFPTVSAVLLPPHLRHKPLTAPI